MSIHSTAIIDPGAVIGDNVTIGPYSIIESDVTIGSGATIGPHVVIHRYTTLGNNCEVHATAVLGDTPQDVAFKDVPSYVNIGNGCTIREGVTIHRGTKEGTTTQVGDGCFLMAFSHLAHNVILGDEVILANGVLLAGYVEVGDKAFISGNAVVHQFTKIGKLAMISGCAAVGKDVPPFCVVQAAQRNAIGGINIVGMRRAGLNVDERKAVKQVFKLLYHSGLNTVQALEEIKQEFPDVGIVQEIVTFIESSERGICGTREDQ